MLSTPLAAPVIAATRLRKGSTNSARGAATLLAQALATARRAGASGTVLVRADSAYYGFDIVETCRRAGAGFSITARLTKTVARAITSIDEAAWTPIRYPNAINDRTNNGGSPTPRSPKCRSPRSPGAAAASTSPPG